MHVEKQFDVRCDRDTAVELVSQDDTLVSLFPDSETEIIAKKGDRKTTRTRYRALGREGTATFHFDTLMDGNVRFEKVCDGKIWREVEYWADPFDPPAWRSQWVQALTEDNS